MKNEKHIHTNSIKIKEEDSSELHAERNQLILEVTKLKKEIHQLKIEKDIYEKASEIIKKDKGINIKDLTNR